MTVEKLIYTFYLTNPGLSNDFFYLQYNLPGEFYTFFLIFLYGKQALYFIAIPVGAAHTRPLE